MARLITEKVAPHYPATLNTIEDYQRSSDMGMKAYYWTDDNGNRVRIHNKSSAELRFWSKVNKDGPIHPVLQTKCWEWMGSRRDGRYGAFTSVEHPNCSGTAHRFSWILNIGEIPNGLYVLHKCDNVICVNPEHLFIGNDADNNRDKIKKGRRGATGILPGDKHFNAKLTDSKVMEIRRRCVKGCRVNGTVALAREFGISQGTVWHIVNRDSWRHLP